MEQPLYHSSMNLSTPASSAAFTPGPYDRRGYYNPPLGIVTLQGPYISQRSNHQPTVASGSIHIDYHTSVIPLKLGHWKCIQTLISLCSIFPFRGHLSFSRSKATQNSGVSIAPGYLLSGTGKVCALFSGPTLRHVDNCLFLCSDLRNRCPLKRLTKPC